MNPRNPAHTPGGSSSGSAAAVAAGLVPLAVGTQTLGSVIRPAAFCGVYAIKPSFGLVNRLGTKLLSETVDTIGFFARSLEDLALVLGATSNDRGLVETAFAGLDRQARGLRLAFCRTPQWEHATPAMREFFQKVEAQLAAEGIGVHAGLEGPLAGLDRLSDLITEFDSRQSLAFERIRHGDRCSPSLRQLFERGARHSLEAVTDAKRRAEAARLQFDRLFDRFDCLVTPSTPGEAPKGLDDTGSPIFNKIWTLLHVPTVNLPAGQGPNGLPLGLQVIAPRYRDELALAGAERLRRALDAKGLLFL